VDRHHISSFSSGILKASAGAFRILEPASGRFLRIAAALNGQGIRRDVIGAIPPHVVQQLDRYVIQSASKRREHHGKENESGKTCRPTEASA
jgi:hypothetical protein